MIVSDERVAQYVGSKVGETFQPPYTCLGVEAGGVITAGIVFNVWTGPDVQLTIAAERHLPRRFLRRVAHYVTKELGCIRATMLTEQARVVDLVKRMGGVPEGRLRNHFGPGRDAVVLGILQEDWII